MQKDHFTIWCNDDFRNEQQSQLEALIDAVRPHTLLRFDRDDDDSVAALKTADIAFGAPDPKAVIASDKLRWVQLNSAGYTSFDHREIKDAMVQHAICLTNSSAVYSEPCAQHVLAMMLSLARQLPAALDSQRADRSWPMTQLRAGSRLLENHTVVILSYGAIARRLVELLRPFNLRVIAVRRHITGDEQTEVVETTRVESVLPLADHLVNVLPANDGTRHFLNEERLSQLKSEAIVYNIGRGTTVDQFALAAALSNGRIAAAYLDVTDPEPLPPDNPLWTTPNCFITPHTGGGHDNEKERQLRHFLDNLRRFEQGEPLLNRVV
jgi:phosphoglycerate dehydrogenase-like enzyme